MQSYAPRPPGESQVPGQCHCRCIHKAKRHYTTKRVLCGKALRGLSARSADGITVFFEGSVLTVSCIYLTTGGNTEILSSLDVIFDMPARLRSPFPQCFHKEASCHITEMSFWCRQRDYEVASSKGDWQPPTRSQATIKVQSQSDVLSTLIRMVDTRLKVQFCSFASF